ncbi:non-reducing end alpha-L-arabinofuranosidase family hydrolase [uncultured Cellulomonas sp.]|uniref:non-reducing end alpha-L-arabinofuranosidase family hydrolase n=1 Tax=uncultured Cellulomonas sp. TaxID=189682 RepID=UPI00261B979B|nr:non-reducing end alpha-L-arabinofuranosidase family hydrolase [uncultured Cellulomonas sp.]
MRSTLPAARRAARTGVAAAFALAAAASVLAVPAAAATDSPDTFEWSSTGPLITPQPDATHGSVAVKDPTIVFHDGEYHVFMTTTPGEGEGWALAYTHFADWADADDAPITYLDQSGIGEGYRAAPQIFFHEPDGLWYLVYQTGNASYSTTDDISDPLSWSEPTNFFADMPQIIRDNIGNGFWLDFWNICDEEMCYLYSSDDNGHLYRAETTLEDFPNGYTKTVIAKEEAERFDLFEGGAVYRIGDTGRYLLSVEAIDDEGVRWFRSWVADSLDAVGDEWVPLAATLENPFLAWPNVTFESDAWTRDVSHGELLRSNVDQTPTIDPCTPLQFLYQGRDPEIEAAYGDLPYRLALLTAQGDNPISAMCSAEVPAFADVPADSPFAVDIAWLAERGLSTGYQVDGQTVFQPAAPMSRQAMAAFLYRYAGDDWQPAAGTQTFTDVGPDHRFYPQIEWLAAMDYADGYSDGTFRGAAPVSRQATAAFLHRLAGSPAVATGPGFTDVHADDPFAEAIAWARASGIADGYDDGSFGVTRPVTRQAMAAFLHRFDTFLTAAVVVQ